MCEILRPLKPQKSSIMLLQYISYYGVTFWPQITYTNTNVAYLLHGKCVIKYKTIMRHNTICTYIYTHTHTHTHYFWSAG